MIDIIKAWMIAANPNEQQILTSEERYEICKACPFKDYNSIIDFEYCNKCGCPLSKKVFSVDNSCPMGYWKK